MSFSWQDGWGEGRGIGEGKRYTGGVLEKGRGKKCLDEETEGLGAF